MNNYKGLKVWQKSRAFVKVIYDITTSFPDNEKYGLISQMRRSAVSIPSNIAEGAGRKTKKDFAHFISIAMGSAYEIETQCWLSMDVSFISEQENLKLIEQITEIQRMLFSFREQLWK